jgi:alpha/beta superfamily hydrolase
MSDLRQLTVEGPVGQLEVIAHMPARAVPLAVAVVCHPHPLYEGSMHNKVVHTLCRGLERLNCVALRFNFRGVGASEGAFAEGLGELEDARAICRWARQEWPGQLLGLAGFSFGAAVALAAAVSEQPFALVTVAPPVGRLFDRDMTTPSCPWLVVQGDEDELVDCELVREWVHGLRPAPRLAVLPGADHFFHGRLVELRDIVSGFVASELPPSAAGMK